MQLLCLYESLYLLVFLFFSSLDEATSNGAKGGIRAKCAEYLGRAEKLKTFLKGEQNTNKSGANS